MIKIPVVVECGGSCSPGTPAVVSTTEERVLVCSKCRTQTTRVIILFHHITLEELAQIDIDGFEGKPTWKRSTPAEKKELMEWTQRVWSKYGHFPETTCLVWVEETKTYERSPYLQLKDRILGT